MLISLNWIKQFVNIPNVDAHDLANDFTMKTAEVEEVVVKGEHLSKVIVAEIKSLRPHPEADKLNLVTFDFGASTTKEVVCGAPNVKVGLKVPYAAIGTTLPGGFTLEPKKIRGILSDGMLCSETELDLGAGSGGLMVLKPEAKNGMTLAQYLEMEVDTVIDVDNKSLTHRPDLWGIYGLAREFSVIYNTPLKQPFNDSWKAKLESLFSSQTSPIKPQVLNSSCLVYLGLSVDNVSVAVSPQWMQERLIASGLRPINSIVDISNYVMLELGIPLHIFDRDKINGQLTIQRLEQDIIFKTLDETDRKLIAGDTVISDEQGPLVLAGIMGGLSSGVTDKTKKVFIEVANWKADEVRVTSTRLGLRTDSSARYEKSLDSSLCYRTMLRTLELILQLNPSAKVVGRIESAGPDLTAKPVSKIATSFSKINSVLGTTISSERILEIFRGLDFIVEVSGNNLMLSVPSYRSTKDVYCEADLIEEIGRIIGYDNIPSTSPLLEVLPVRLTSEKSIHNKIKDYFSVKAQSLEIMTYPLVGKSLLAKSSWPVLNDELVLINALSTDADRMRPSLIPSALEAAARNTKYYEQFSFFELGRSYIYDSKEFSRETNQLLYANFSKASSTFVSVLEQIEDVLNHLGLSFELTSEKNPKFSNPIVPESWIGNHPHEYVNVKVMGKFIGAIFTIHPLVMRNFKMKGHLTFAVLDLSSFESREIKEKVKYKAINKFPVSTFDCSVIVSRDVPADETLKVFKSLKLKEFTHAKIIAVFDLGDGQRSVTIRSYFEDDTKTLDSDFIKSAENLVLSCLNKAGFPLKS